MDIFRRTSQHNRGTGARYTKMNSPVELVYWETQSDKKTAQKRELVLKKLGHNKKHQLIYGNPKIMKPAFDPFQYEYYIVAPGRVNLLGEHVDYNGGPVLPAAIDRQMNISANPRKDNILHLKALDLTEETWISLDQLDEKIDVNGNPLPDWALYPAGIAWIAQKRSYPISGVDAIFTSNIPIGSGLSSSAAMEVGFAALWRELDGWKLDNLELAILCQQAENQYVGVNCGLMDQFASANGVVGSALYFNTNNLDWKAVNLPPSVSIVIADSKKRRSLSTSGYNDRRTSCEEAVAILKQNLPSINNLRDVTIHDFSQNSYMLNPIQFKRARHVVEECHRVDQAMESLSKNDIIQFGELMKQGHQSLKDLYEVSLPELDTLVNIANALPGCFGARLTGAGFGGCTVSLVEEKHAKNFVEQLKDGYKKATGIEADIYICKATQGVHVEWRKPS